VIRATEANVPPYATHSPAPWAVPSASTACTTNPSGRPRHGRATASALAGFPAVVESQPLVDDLAGEVQDCGVVLQDEFGVGG
jgi:hypothetical protein